MTSNELTYAIALQMVPMVGPTLAKNLIAYCGSPEAVFKEKKNHLLKIPGIGNKTSESVISFKNFERVENEITFIRKHQIKPLFYLEEDYPQRLRDIEEAPLLLYYKGNTDLNKTKVLAFVGTRNATDYGKKMCRQLVEGLQEYEVLIVSGLALGIDHCAHKTALDLHLPTVGVLGHGLDTIYPPQHRLMAVKMIKNGGLLTEYPSGTKPDKENFPARNRIVAGMVDGVVVVESAARGGALITAEIANSYNREIFAVPGRTTDEISAGCNKLIRFNKACMVESVNDLAYHLGWDFKKDQKNENKINFAELTDIEKNIVDIIRKEEKINIDKLLNLMNINLPELSLILLDMEFRGFVKPLPGNFYKIA